MDIGLPQANGLELVQRLRARRAPIPVLILTARDTLDDCVDSLNVGADDFMTKPFRLPELVARVRALVRRSARRDHVQARRRRRWSWTWGSM
ncbi:MAG: response regulator [Chromatiales bacterium]|nr:response regulator [Chromatiales bacterium]